MHISAHTLHFSASRDLAADIARQGNNKTIACGGRVQTGLVVLAMFHAHSMRHVSQCFWQNLRLVFGGPPALRLQKSAKSEGESGGYIGVRLMAVLIGKTSTPCLFRGCLFFFASHPETETDKKTSGRGFSSVALCGFFCVGFGCRSGWPPGNVRGKARRRLELPCGRRRAGQCSGSAALRRSAAQGTTL